MDVSSPPIDLSDLVLALFWLLRRQKGAMVLSLTSGLSMVGRFQRSIPDSPGGHFTHAI
jgi:hypothetical protein